MTICESRPQPVTVRLPNRKTKKYKQKFDVSNEALLRKVSWDRSWSLTSRRLHSKHRSSTCIFQVVVYIYIYMSVIVSTYIGTRRS